MYVEDEIYFDPEHKGRQSSELGWRRRIAGDTEVRKFDPLKLRSGSKIDSLKSSYSS